MAKLLWTQKQDIGPATRHSLDLVYDAARSRVVAFGGQIGQTLAHDTWEWDGENWTQMSNIGPAPRLGHVLAYDATRQRSVLFGGTSKTGLIEAQFVLGDTWEWDGEAWTQVANTGPLPRAFHAMAYDSKRERTLLFGGVTESQGKFVNFADTWSWDGNEWTEQEDAGPPGRNGHRLVYDTIRDRAVLFGGVTDAKLVNDTWENDGSLWTQMADTGPDPRVAYGMVYNDANTLLFGGSNFADKFGDTWTWDGKHWTQRQDIGPSKRSSHGMAYDPSRKRTVLFGGNSDQDLGDTWEAFERPLPAVV
jgi:hypothetical protein